MYFILCYPVNCVLTNNNFNHFCIFVLVETSGSQEASQEARKHVAKALDNTPAAQVMQTGFVSRCLLLLISVPRGQQQQHTEPQLLKDV